MRRTILATLLTFITPILCATLAAAELTLTNNMNVEAREIYIQFFPSDRLLKIREYGLSTLLTDEVEVQQQTTELQELVKTGRYCKTRFGLDGFAAGQEVLFASGNAEGKDLGAHVECVLVTETEMPESMITAFSNTLARQVNVAGTPSEIALTFRAPDLEIGPTNALKILDDPNSDQLMISWRNGERYYEMVVINSTKPRDSFKSLFPYIQNFPISSPVLGKQEVEQLRATLRGQSN